MIAVAAGWEPDYEAFTAGLELGMYACLLAVAVLAVIAAVRRILAV